MDVVVTLPKKFGLERWLAEGDAPGEPWTGQLYEFTVPGIPDIAAGDRVYIVYDGHLIGYAPLVKVHVTISTEPQYKASPSGGRARKRTGLIRGGGAVACTTDEYIPGFRGYRYRWWEREAERILQEASV